MAVKPIPDGYHTVTPYLMVRGAEEVRRFLEEGLGAKTIRVSRSSSGVIMNAELRVGSSMVMISEARGGYDPMPGQLYLYVEDTDALYRRAIQAGGKSIMEPADQFYGDRNAGVKDPAGNNWWIATHKEDVSDEEIERRAAAYGKR